MEKLHKSSSHVQAQAEEVIFHKVEELFNLKFEKNKKILIDLGMNNKYITTKLGELGVEHGEIDELKSWLKNAPAIHPGSYASAVDSLQVGRPQRREIYLGSWRKKTC